MPLPRDRLVTIEEVAEFLGLSAHAMRTQRWRGNKPGTLGFLVGRNIRFRAQDIEAWVDEKAAEQREAAS